MRSCLATILVTQLLLSPGGGLDHIHPDAGGGPGHESHPHFHLRQLWFCPDQHSHSGPHGPTGDVAGLSVATDKTEGDHGEPLDDHDEDAVYLPPGTPDTGCVSAPDRNGVEWPSCLVAPVTRPSLTKPT